MQDYNTVMKKNRIKMSIHACEYWINLCDDFESDKANGMQTRNMWAAENVT